MNKDKGQFIIEVLVAVTVISLVLVASMLALVRAQKLTRQARNKQQGTKIAQSVLETIRKTEADDPSAFFVAGTCASLSCGVVAAPYVCHVDCMMSGAPLLNAANISVTVNWQEADTTESVVLVTSLTNSNP